MDALAAWHNAGFYLFSSVVQAMAADIPLFGVFYVFGVQALRRRASDGRRASSRTHRRARRSF